MKLLHTIIILLMPFWAFSQTQTIRGNIKDKVTQQSIIGATVVVSSVKNEGILATSTDLAGNFEIENVPLGRQTIRCTFVGYQDFESEGFIVSSTKEVFLEIEMIEGGIDVGEVVVSASNNVNAPINELSVVSTRSFSADETDRIAASVNDPGRMAMAYPGVAQGSDDTENDIIIRGNSSFGMLWRLEGIDIPNPNHFARPGTSGGGMTIFSAQLMSRSDFSTGGMAAEYGNAISGAFDIHFRKGNMNERQHRFKFGVLGIDFATEGPIKKGESSYLINYRYSTLGLLTTNGIYLVGERVENTFQDLSFNIAFDGHEKNRFTIFGIGGLSQEHYNPVENPLERKLTDIAHWEDRTRDGDMGAIGATFTRLIDKKSYFKAGVSLMGSNIDFYYDVLDSVDNRSNYHDERHRETRISSSYIYSRKINRTTRFKTGMFVNFITNYEFYKKTVERSSVSDIIAENTNLSVNGSGSTQTFQYYAQLSKDFTKTMTLNAGAHFMYLPLNGTYSVEPRLSFKYTPTPKHSVSLAYGLHSKILPMATYFYAQYDTTQTASGQNIATNYPNMELPFIKSHHFIASYNYTTENGLKLTAEGYYQHLFNVPIATDADDIYWMLNTRSTFPETTVTADGTGQNYGIDLAAEKFFSSKLYFLLTASFFKSYFYPKNGQRYHTTFANDFVTGLTIGREFAFKKGRILQIGARVLYNGGNRYSPLDEAASEAAEVYIIDKNQAFSKRIPNYFRIDTRISYRYNTRKLAGSISLDIQNVTNRQNPNNVNYNKEINRLSFSNHSSGLVPVLAFQFDF
ncbi:MAG: TonB-dependent receptor [Saprospiraceae bacterium]